MGGPTLLTMTGQVVNKNNAEDIVSQVRLRWDWGRIV